MHLNFTKQEVKHAVEKKLRIDRKTTKENNAWYCLDGKKQLRVTYPKGSGALPTGTAYSIINQLKLSKAQFSDLIKCPMSADEYETHIRARLNIPK